MATLTDEQLHALAQRAYDAFIKYPNVHAVAIGNRERGGREVDELAITVFVTHKLPRSALAADGVIPPVFEGVPTDVVEMGIPQLAELGDIPGMAADSKDLDEGRYRPLKGGIQISGDALTNGRGTLGFLAKVQGDARIMAVTNWHVLFDNDHLPSAGMRVGNPDTSDSCSNCTRGSFGGLVTQDYTTVDAAISRLDPNTQWLAEIQCIGFVTGWNTVTMAQAQSRTYKVRKYGRTTRLTGGTVRRVGLVATVHGPNRPPRLYSNGILIEPNRPLGGDQAKFGDEGDSGAAVVNAANEVVGILFAVILDTSSANYGWGIAFPVNDMATRFQQQNKIQLIPATATRIGDVQTTPAASSGSRADAAAAEVLALGHRIEHELSGSEQGRQLAALWMRHSYELGRLVNHNRKVGALWLRNGGPALFQYALRAAKLRDQIIPPMIDGRPFDACVDSLMDVFVRYGSDALKADLQAHRAALPPLGGRSYEEIVAHLQDRRRG
jgi:hypothetical protein